MRVVGQIAILGLLLLTGCSDNESLVGPDEIPKTEFERFHYFKTLWDSNKPADYDFSIQHLCECGLEYLWPRAVKVRVDTLFSIHNLQNGQNEPSSYPQLFTIEYLFDSIDLAVELGVDSLSVVYDHHYGYPLEINIDFTFSGVDDELRIIVWDFQAK